MRKILYIFCIIIIQITICFSDESSDSLIKRFPEVNIISSRLSNNPLTSFFPISIIDKETIYQKGSWQISEIIDLSPGIYVKDYGGLGGLKTISIRGTTASQTLILLDGMKLNSSQNGIVDLSILPISLINEIEIVRSGSSAFYGSNAIGGCLNIITSNGEANKFNLNAIINYGQYNDLLTHLTFSFPLNHFIISSTIEFTKSSGKYPFVFNQFGKEEELIRENADFTNLITSVSGRLNFQDWTSNSRLIVRLSERGSPGAVVQGYIEDSEARLKEKEALFINSIKKIFSNLSNLSLSLNFRYNELNYNDKNSIAQKESNYYNNEVLINASYNTIILGANLNFIFEAGMFSLFGNNINNLQGGEVQRHNLANAIIINLPFEIDNWYIRLMGAGRIDYYSDWKCVGTYNSGINVEHLNLPFSFRGQFSTNYRMPNFNELYYFNFGSQDLVPEESKSLNFGISTSFLSIFRINLDVFYIKTQNQIVSIPKSPFTWSAANVGEVETKGIEIGSSIILFDSLMQISFAYTLQKASDKSESSLTNGKLIPYIPQELLKIEAKWIINNLSFGIETDYTGFRFSLPDNSEKSFLPAFFLVDLFGNYKFHIGLNNINLSLRIKNVFNSRYSVIMNYPMPGIIIRGGISLEI